MLLIQIMLWFLGIPMHCRKKFPYYYCRKKCPGAREDYYYAYYDDYVAEPLKSNTVYVHNGIPCVFMIHKSEYAVHYLDVTPSLDITTLRC
jgi:hypothetical protein